MSAFTFAEVLSPLNAESFMRQTYQVRPALSRSDSCRFGTLVTWDDLNRLLKQHASRVHKCKLLRDGTALPDSDYSRWVSDSCGSYRILDYDAITKYMRRGATLALNMVDDISDPIANLSSVLEAALGEDVHANLYVAFGQATGFGLHWDNQDVFVTQIAGHKKWRIFEPTIKYPVSYTPSARGNVSSPPYFEALLEPGDLLYIPRGWWHDAVAIDEPVMHVTFAVRCTTGCDLLRWLVDRLESIEVVRADLPRFASRASQDERLSAIKAAVELELAALSLESYLSKSRARSSKRENKTNFPWSAGGFNRTIEESTLLRLQVAAVIQSDRDDNRTIFEVSGKRLSCPAKAVVVMDSFKKTPVIRMGDLLGIHSDTDPNDIYKLVCSLIAVGLLSVDGQSHATGERPLQSVAASSSGLSL